MILDPVAEHGKIEKRHGNFLLPVQADKRDRHNIVWEVNSRQRSWDAVGYSLY